MGRAACWLARGERREGGKSRPRAFASPFFFFFFKTVFSYLIISPTKTSSTSTQIK
jgi:hypothetical protein